MRTRTNGRGKQVQKKIVIFTITKGGESEGYNKRGRAKEKKR
jgi:hypothetical protein